MEKGCLIQIQQWRNSSITIKYPVRYHRHRPHIQSSNITMIAFLTIIVCLSTSVWITPCVAERISGNGQDDLDRRVARAASRGPCLPDQYLTPVQTAFKSTIPTFNQRSLTIQLKSDLRVQIGPDDPSLVPFLQSYYAAALKQIAQAKLSSSQEEKLGCTAMFLYFNTEYTRFLTKVGVPLSCVSYFFGATDWQDVSQLQELTLTLQKRYLSQQDRNNGFKCLFGESTTGPEIFKMFNFPNAGIFTPKNYLKDESRNAADCELMIFYIKDGSVMVKMPTLDIEARELNIPYTSSPIRIGPIDVSYQIGRYIATGINCLDNDGQRRNFTGKVVEWMQNEVLYQLVQTPTCLPGFGGILPFIVSVQHYVDTLHDIRRTDEFDIQPTDYDYPVKRAGTTFSRTYSGLQKISEKEKERALTFYLDPSSQLFEQATLSPSEEAHQDPHNHNKSSWFLTFFMTLIFLLILLYLCTIFFGKGPRDFLKCLKAAGMRLKNKRRRGKKLRENYSELQPQYERLPTSETEDASGISEKEDTTVFGSRYTSSFPASTETENESNFVSPSIPTSEFAVEPEKFYQRGRDKTPIVEIHSSGRETIRLEITTDAECYATSVNVDEEDCDEDDKRTIESGATCHMSELDFDEEDEEYYDDNENAASANQHHDNHNVKRKDLGDKNSSLYFTPADHNPLVHDGFDDGATSTSTSTSVKLSPGEEQQIYQRYAGPNAVEKENEEDALYSLSRLTEY